MTTILLKTQQTVGSVRLGMLTIGLAYLAFAGACAYGLPFHPVSALLLILSISCLIAAGALFFREDIPWFFSSFMGIFIFISPPVMSMFAIVLTAGTGGILSALAYLSLAYVLILSFTEYLLIDFNKLPASVRLRAFSKAGRGRLYFDAHSSVLFLSPWRKDESFFFAHPIVQRLQIALAMFLFLYMAALTAYRPGTQGQAGLAWFGLMLSILAIVAQPLLLQHLIKLRIVWMKSKGII